VRGRASVARRESRVCYMPVLSQNWRSKVGLKALKELNCNRRDGCFCVYGENCVHSLLLCVSVCCCMCGVRCFHIAAETRKSWGGYKTMSEKSWYLKDVAALGNEK